MRRRRFGASKKTLLFACGLALVIGVTVAAVILNSARKELSSDPVAEVITYSTDRPDETKPDDETVWEGTDSDPKKIIIPSLGVNNYIQNVGIDQNQEVAVPNNIHYAGWFVDSVRPGDKGLSIIDGHLNGSTEDGIFIHLDKLKTGETFAIEFGDGSSRSFRVMTVDTVDLDKAASVLFSQHPTTTNQLNLITCGGTYNREARLYNKRIIVAAELQ